MTDPGRNICLTLHCHLMEARCPRLRDAGSCNDRGCGMMDRGGSHAVSFARWHESRGGCVCLGPALPAALSPFLSGF